jgi:hypothetical protein
MTARRELAHLRAAARGLACAETLHRSAHYPKLKAKALAELELADVRLQETAIAYARAVKP